jgi:predicted RNA binding protein YcfA (HicA-like mRNA interferase family)
VRLAVIDEALLSSRAMKFSELVRLLEQCGFRLVKEKGSIRYYAKAGHPRLNRVDFHGAKEGPTGTCHAILKAVGLQRK